MNRVRPTFCIILILVLVVSSAFCAEKRPSEQELDKIRAAVPRKPHVEPQKQRKILVFSVSYGYYHTAIPYGQAAFKILGEKTGAYETVVSDDISMFEPENLKQFDAVVFNNINQEVFAPENLRKLDAKEHEEAVNRYKELRNSLADFIAGGKGLVAIHAATNAFRDWPEYGDIVGARFDNHPWESGSTVTLKVEDPEHPLNSAFKTPSFTYKDEVYQVKNFSRENLRVLLSIDTQKTFVRLDHVTWVHRKDDDFAIAWIKKYEKGRIFYSAIGHDHELYWHPVVLQHWLDGIQFVLGDLDADTTPNPKPTNKENR